MVPRHAEYSALKQKIKGQGDTLLRRSLPRSNPISHHSRFAVCPHYGRTRSPTTTKNCVWSLRSCTCFSSCFGFLHYYRDCHNRPSHTPDASISEKLHSILALASCRSLAPRSTSSRLPSATAICVTIMTLVQLRKIEHNYHAPRRGAQLLCMFSFRFTCLLSLRGSSTRASPRLSLAHHFCWRESTSLAKLYLGWLC